MKLTGKIIAITGASGGLGTAIALSLCRHNPVLILIGRNHNRLQSLKKEIEDNSGAKVMIVQCDIGDKDDIERTGQKLMNGFSRIDVLINNAGITSIGTVEFIPTGILRKIVEVNLLGTMIITKTLLPLLRKSGSAYVLSVGSLLAETSMAGTSVYSASKKALAVFSDILGTEERGNNIRTGCFLPGPIDTAFNSRDGERTLATPKALIIAPAAAAKAVERMIFRRMKKFSMYGWILAMMRLKNRFK